MVVPDLVHKKLYLSRCKHCWSWELLLGPEYMKELKTFFVLKQLNFLIQEHKNKVQVQAVDAKTTCA